MVQMELLYDDKWGIHNKMDRMQEEKIYLGLVDEYEVPEGYDCYVWAGDFCVNGIEWCIRTGKKYEVLQEEDMTEADIHNMYRYLEEVKNKIIEYLKDILNEYHKTNYGEYKWKILLNVWLAHFLPSMYDKVLKLRRIKTENRIFHIDLYNTDCVEIALDQLDFFYMLRNDFGFHKYEYSLLLKNMTNVANIVVDNFEIYERIPFHANYAKLPEHVKSFVEEYRRYKEETNVQDEMVVQSSYIKFTLYKEVMEKKYGKLSGYFLDYTNQVRGEMSAQRALDIEWRTSKRHISEEGIDEFVCLVYKIIGYFLPIAYLEEFDYLKSLALRNYKWGMKPKVLLFDCEGTAINELFKIYMMNIDVEHVLKVDVMHAPPYGMGGFSWYELSEFQLCNEFLTCSEMTNNTLKTKFVRMPYINFFRVPNRRMDDTGNSIVYANYAYPQHRGRLSMCEWNWKRYIDGELEFLNMLDEGVISELKFRMHPFQETQWNYKEKVKKIVPGLIFDEEPIFFESIRQAKLVISEVLGAAALEAIGMGKPTIIFYNPVNLFVELNENYKDVEDMIRVDLIAETPKKLAMLVNRIHDNVESWWNEPERQEVVRRIRDKYIYFPENAKEIWINRIMSYLEE